jgi:hypothetical protein
VVTPSADGQHHKSLLFEGCFGRKWRLEMLLLSPHTMLHRSCHAAATCYCAGGAPEMLSTLLEGESLFNDATSIVLFEIFLHLGMAADAGSGDVSLTGAAWGIVKLIGWLSMTGAAAGLLMGFTTRCACLGYVLLMSLPLPLL